jgi:ketosteroid isomerase-like protein
MEVFTGGAHERRRPGTLRALARNAHNIDAIMGMMADDCVFDIAGGTEPWGTRHEGSVAVRKRFAEVWRDIPDARWEDGRHVAAGDNGCSTWTFRGTAADGSPMEIEGCDVFTFRDGTIARKSTFLKQRR